VKEVSKNYSGVSWKECICSPHHPKTFLDIQGLFEELNRPKEQRKIVCPETQLPIHAESLLFSAGMIDRPLSSKNGPNWWNFDLGRKHGHLRENNLETKLIMENGKVFHKGLFDKLNKMLSGVGGDIHRVSKAYAVDNKILRSAFESFLDSIGRKHHDSPSLFKKRDWENLPKQPKQWNFVDQEAFKRIDAEYQKKYEEVNFRKRLLKHLASHFCKFREEFNEGHRDLVSPMIQGTTEGAAWKIIGNGFATVVTVDDGFFGKGIYLTSDLNYASHYAVGNTENQKETNEDKEKVFLLALTIPGNPFPIIESPFITGFNQTLEKNPKGYLGKACNPGYQSHYTIVPKADIANAFPIGIDERIDLNIHADELAIFQEAQALPLFLMYYQSNPFSNFEFQEVDEPSVDDLSLSDAVSISELESGKYQIEIDLSKIPKAFHFPLFNFVRKHVGPLFSKDPVLVLDDFGTKEESLSILNAIQTLLDDLINLYDMETKVSKYQIAEADCHVLLVALEILEEKERINVLNVISKSEANCFFDKKGYCFLYFDDQQSSDEIHTLISEICV